MLNSNRLAAGFIFSDLFSPFDDNNNKRAYRLLSISYIKWFGRERHYIHFKFVQFTSINETKRNGNKSKTTPAQEMHDKIGALYAHRPYITSMLSTKQQRNDTNLNISIIIMDIRYTLIALLSKSFLCIHLTRVSFRFFSSFFVLCSIKHDHLYFYSMKFDSNLLCGFI